MARKVFSRWVARVALALAGVGAALPALGQSDGDLLFAVSEGTSGGTDHARVIAKYADLAARMGRATGRRVRVVFVREFAALEEGMRSGQFALVMARPSDYPARGLRDHGYQYVASAKPEGRCMIYADKQSGIKTLAEARSRPWVMPESVAYMTRFCRAALRDQGIAMANLKVQHVREQAAVKFYMDNGFADVGGVASYAGARKAFEKDGATLIHQSVPQPYFPLIASKVLRPEQIKAVQSALSTMANDAAGQAVLKQVGVEGFDITTEARLRALNDWLEKP